MKALTTALLLVLATKASASEPGIKVHVDDATLAVWLTTSGDGEDKSHYRFHVTGELHGDKKFGSHDKLRVDWKQKGKVVASQKCEPYLDARANYNPNFATFDCTLDNEVKLQSHGDHEFDIVFRDDDNDVESVIRSGKVKVLRYWDFKGMDGKKPKHSTVFQINGNELLGHTTLKLPQNPGAQISQLTFSFWATTAKRQGQAQYDMRCTVDGKKVPGDFASGQWLTVDEYVVAEDNQYQKNNGDPVKYGWFKLTGFTNLAHRTKLFKDDKAADNQVDITNLPGAWVCTLRMDSKPLREFRFVVDKSGKVAKHPEQDAGLWFSDEYRLIETRFPSGNELDTMFDPDAIKKQGFFGRAWAKPDAFKDAWSALPKKKGTFEAPLAAGKK